MYHGNNENPIDYFLHPLNSKLFTRYYVAVYTPYTSAQIMCVLKGLPSSGMKYLGSQNMSLSTILYLILSLILSNHQYLLLNLIEDVEKSFRTLLMILARGRFI